MRTHECAFILIDIWYLFFYCRHLERNTYLHIYIDVCILTNTIMIHIRYSICKHNFGYTRQHKQLSMQENIYAHAFQTLCQQLSVPVVACRHALRTKQAAVRMRIKFMQSWGGCSVAAKAVSTMGIRLETNPPSPNTPAIMLWQFIGQIFRARRGETECLTEKDRDASKGRACGKHFHVSGVFVG